MPQEKDRILLMPQALSAFGAGGDGLASSSGPGAWTRVLRRVFLFLTLALLCVRFLHLTADFPNDSPWMDWAKFTDEGWYGDAAIRHFVMGHWYVRGDFNPAVALPVWPLVEAGLFHFTGVSLAAARALTVCTFGVTLFAAYCLMERFPRRDPAAGRAALAGAAAVFLLAASPFLYVFSRMAILEPPLVMLTMLTLLTASCMRPWVRGERASEWMRDGLLSLLLGLLLVCMVLTKTTAIALLPGVAYMLWYRAGYRVWSALRLAAPPALFAGLLWAGYMLLLVRPHYLEDYRYLFAANAFKSFQTDPLATVLASTFADGGWIGVVLYPAFFALVALTLFTRPALYRNPLVCSLLLMTAGYFFFLAYHNNLQPRYYLVPAVPITMLVAYGLEELLHAPFRPWPALLYGGTPPWRVALCGALLLAIAVPDLWVQTGFVLHPQYTFVQAAQAIARIVRASPQQSPLLLSISGSDLSLMTGLPSINDDYGTLDLDRRARQYRPGWYVAWNMLEDDKMDALEPAFHPVRIAAFPAMDDPERNQLILYRLDP